MTCRELLNKLHSNYYRFGGYSFDHALSAFSKITIVKGDKWERGMIILILMYKKIDDLTHQHGIIDVPIRIKFDANIKRKHIVSVFAEAGLKVTRYTREYGKTIVYFEPISDSQ